MRRVIVLLLSLSLLVAALPGAALAAPAQGGTWIVTLRDGVDARTAAPALARQHGGVATFVYTHALNGFAFRGSAASAGALARNPQVSFVEADAAVQLDTTQSDATWGLDRIDQRSLPLDRAYTYQATGSGVTAYVIDSGIRTSHGDFDGRATASAASDFIGDGRNGQDCNGHGTHVAGTIGGETYGVAKAVSLVSVRVFGCTGGSAWSVIIAGIDWVTRNAAKPAVANLSLSGGGSFSVDNAMKNMIASGVSASVAAGNSGADACGYSPARVAAAMTIGATDKTDTKPSWSNYGNCVDWFAPGVGITSAAISSDTATTSKSGTSMAAPHTAGVAALYLQSNTDASAAEVGDAIRGTLTTGVVKSTTMNNHLLYTGSESPPPPNTPPSATNATVSTTAGTPVSVTLSGSDAESCDLAFTIVTAPSFGTLGTVTGSPCTSGSPNSDTATVTYTPTDSADDSFTYKVTDGVGNDSTAATVTIDVVALEEPSSPMTLAATGYKIKGVKHVDLTWTNATTTQVDVFVGSTKVGTTANDGDETYSLNSKGGGSYTFTVCEAGTDVCSNAASVSY